MPGHNHYPWCTCGWCVKYGRNRYSASDLLISADLYSAKRFLKEHGVGRYVSACFVNPNARCPVCGASVFYYQNAHGSRVYFDDLGPPWPKHPCSNRETCRPPSKGSSVEPPQKRKRGLMLELLEAAQKLAASVGGNEAEEYENGWTLLWVKGVEREGWKNRVTAEFLGLDETKEITFSFDSANEVVKCGDVISLRDAKISLFDIERMKTRTYSVTIEEWPVGEDPATKDE